MSATTPGLAASAAVSTQTRPGEPSVAEPGADADAARVPVAGPGPDEVVAAGVRRPRKPLTPQQRGYRVGVVVLLVVTGVWRVFAMVQWSWGADDWTLVERAHVMPFWDYVGQVYNGHLFPGDLAIVWVVTRIDPLNFYVYIAAAWLMIMTSVLLWVLLFRALFGERWAALVGVIPIALAPGFVAVAVWPAATLTVYALQLFMALTLLCSLGWIRRGSVRSLILTVVSMTLGLLFWEKCVLIVIPVLGLGLLLCRRPSGRVHWRRFLTLGAAVVVLALVYLPIYLAVVRASGSTSVGFQPRDFGTSVIFYWSALTQAILPAVTSGPWASSVPVNTGLLVPSTGIQFLTLALVTGLVVWGLMRRRHGWVPVATTAGYVLVTVGMLLTSSRFGFAGLMGALDFRYVADAVAVACLMGTLLLIPAKGEHDVIRHATTTRRPLAPWVGPATGVVVMAFAVGTSGTEWDAFKVTSPRPWVDALVTDARAAGSSSVLNTNARPDVFNAYLSGSDARIAAMLAPLELPLRWNEPAPTILVADVDGHLRPGVVGETSTSVAGPVAQCGYLVQPGSRQRVSVNRPAFDWEWGLQLRYYSQRGGTLRVDVDKDSAVLPLKPGVASMQAVIHSPVTSFTISSSPDSGPICVDSIQAGLLTPGPGAPPSS